MNAMVEMSRAIRLTVERFCPLDNQTITGIPDEALDDFVQIVGAFYGDLRDEQRSRLARHD